MTVQQVLKILIITLQQTQLVIGEEKTFIIALILK